MCVCVGVCKERKSPAEIGKELAGCGSASRGRRRIDRPPAGSCDDVDVAVCQSRRRRRRRRKRNTRETHDRKNDNDCDPIQSAAAPITRHSQPPTLKKKQKNPKKRAKRPFSRGISSRFTVSFVFCCCCSRWRLNFNTSDVHCTVDRVFLAIFFLNESRLEFFSVLRLARWDSSGFLSDRTKQLMQTRRRFQKPQPVPVPPKKIIIIIINRGNTWILRWKIQLRRGFPSALDGSMAPTQQRLAVAKNNRWKRCGPQRGPDGTVGRVDSQVDGQVRDALVGAGDAVRVGLDLAADVVEIRKDLALGVQKLAVLVGRVEQLQDQRPARHDARTARQKVPKTTTAIPVRCRFSNSHWSSCRTVPTGRPSTLAMTKKNRNWTE